MRRAPVPVDLLLAAFGLDARAGEAWRRWRSDHHVRDLDLASAALAPQLYLNLRWLGIQDEGLSLLKGAYRKCWYENQLCMTRLERVLAAIGRAGIPTMLVGPAGRAAIVPGSLGARLIEAPTFAVRAEHASATATILADSGWLRTHDGELGRPWRRSERLTDEAHAIRIKWQLLPESRVFGDEAFWGGAVPVTVGGSAALALAAADALLETALVPGAEIGIGPHSRELEAILLLRRPGHVFSWERLREQAQRLRVLPVVRRFLTTLSRQYDTPVPRDWIATSGSRRRGVEHWRRFQALAPKVSGQPRLTGFVLYARDLLELDHWWEVPCRSWP